MNKEIKLIKQLDNLYQSNIIVDFVKNSIFHDEHEALRQCAKNQFRRCLNKNPELATKHCNLLLADIFDIIEKQTNFKVGRYNIFFIGNHKTSYAFEIELIDHIKEDEFGITHGEYINFLVNSEEI
jgi:hypothetical protein